MTVFSRLHLLRTNVPIDPNRMTNGYHVLADMARVPSFVCQRDALEMLSRTDCVGAMRAMIEANILKLPYPEMMFEWQSRNGNSANMVGPRYGLDEEEPVHEFILLKERDDGFIEARYAFYFLKSRVGGIYEDWFRIRPNTGDWEIAFYKDTDMMMKNIALSPCLMAIHVAFVLMNMKGIEREVHHNEALNKQRIRKGKPAISQYSYIRIGHVYKADGTRIKYTDGDHRHMPMHVRSAHTRRQHFGKNNEETKLIYVPSCIVNFDPQGTVPVPKQRIVKA